MTPGAKLLALALFAVALSFTDNIVLLLGMAGAVVVLWRFNWAQLALNLKPVFWILLAIFVFQFFAGGFWPAFDTALTVATLVAAAAWVSATTRTDEMLDALKKTLAPLKRVNLNPNSIAFVLVFTVRLVPFVAQVGREALAARLARGATRNPLAALVPSVIRLMRETDQIAEALVARGFARS
jgi:biotin transport system permease protein